MPTHVDNQSLTDMYDHENRTTLVKKPLGAGFVAVATEDYAALGRRIEAVDAVAGTTTRMYYDDRYFVFGNYIDEVLVMNDGTGDLYYAHDHLYSAVALFDAAGAVAERYEYDAYGSVQILNSQFLILNSSQYGNPYTFTGRELDTLDNGRLTLMYYRARTYDPDTGRFMQCDPHGINPAGGKINPFNVQKQISEGGNIYEYASSNSMSHFDPQGLMWGRPPGKPLTRKPRSEEECCKQADNDQIRGQSNGTVVCCDGRKVACVWGTPYDNLIFRPRIQRDATKMRIECAMEHEKLHLDNHTGKCEGFIPCNPTLYRAPITGDSWWPWDTCKSAKVKAQYEVEAYTKQLDCLRKSVEKCKELEYVDQDCEAEIYREIELIKEIKASKEAKAKKKC